MKLGKLQEVDIRKVWPHEQYDFSKWLATDENIKELGDTLNLSLTDVETEKFVGNYRCDILCKDEITGKMVLDNYFYQNLKGARFEAGIRSFFSLSADVLQDHYEKLAAREARAPLVAVIVGLIAAAVVGSGSVLGVFLYYRKKRHGETYPLDRYARLQLTAREDRFVGSFVTRTRIQRNNGSRSGGSRSGGGGRRGGR